MVVTLKKHGNRHALIINRTMMEQTGITEDTPLQVSGRGRTMIVEPAQTADMPDDVFRKAAAKVFRERYDLLKRLA